MMEFKRDLLDDLTVCIFTLNRKLDLERLVNYLKTSGAKVLILDASNEPIILDQTYNFKYIHVPNMPLQARLSKFSELVTTKYILLSPDDDFWALNGLIETVRFLDLNSDYASAQGLRTRFFDFPFFHWIPDYVNQMELNYTQDNKIERLFDMATGMHYIYSVIRLNEYVKITNCIKNVNSINRNSLAMNELIFNYTLPILGKHRVLPVFYSARKSHPFEASDVDFDRWINDKADIEAIKFRKNIVEFYRKELDISEPEAISVFQQLTTEFTRLKLVPVEKFKGIKKYLRIIVTGTRLRVFRKISKIKYLFFYKLLFVNKTFFIFIRDIVHIKRFLNKNRIN
jgi:glycosyltransferase domain-containing protein